MKLFISGAMALSLLGTAPAISAGLVPEGRRDAVLDCSACHRVTRDQKPPAPVYDRDQALTVVAPSFDAIARQYAGRPGSLRAFIRAPRHPMREQQFLERDLTAIGHYIASLQGQQW